MGIFGALAAFLVFVTVCGLFSYRFCERLKLGWAGVVCVGYMLANLLFFPAYWIFGSVPYATVAVLFVLAGAGLVVQWRQGGRLKMQRPGLIVAGAVAVLALWPYLFTGYGLYWHSGNNDIFDSLRGRDAYFSRQITIHNAVKDREIIRALETKSGPEIKADFPKWSGWFDNEYTEDSTRLQYSSVALASAVIGETHGMDAFLIQALFNLLLMGYGIAVLARETASLAPRWANACGAAAVGCNFYLTTYFAGHQGSMMYMAVLPFVLLVAYRGIVDGWSWGHGLFLLVTLGFVSNCYPFPLPYALFGLLIFWLWRWWEKEQLRLFGFWQSIPARRQSLIALLLLLVIVVMTALVLKIGWDVAAPFREKAHGQFRSWGSAVTYVGFFQFLGLWPSYIPSIPWLRALAEHSVVIAASAVAGVGVLVVMARGFATMIRAEQRLFPACALSFLIFFPVMLWVVQDSYYFYKFLYINQFIFVVAFFAAIAQKGRWFKLIGIGVVTANIAWGWVAGWVWFTKPFNKDYSEFSLVTKIPSDVLAKVYLDVPKIEYREVLKQTLIAAEKSFSDLRDSARYVLRMPGVDDVYSGGVGGVIWQDKSIAVYQAADEDYLVVNSYWEPEVTESGRVFRWVSDRRSGLIKIRWFEPRSAYMYFCAESGPSIDYAAFDLVVRTPSKKFIRELHVDASACFWLPKEDFSEGGAVVISSDSIGRIISPLEGRRLNYQIFNFGVSAGVGVPYGVISQGLKKDIDLSRVHLSNGWYGVEADGEQHFRWAGDSVQFHAEGPGKRVVLDLAPGPGLPPNAELMLLSADGRVLQRKPLPAERSQVFFDLVDSPLSHAVPQKFELKSAVSGSAVGNDPRILNYRVFGLLLE